MRRNDTPSATLTAADLGLNFEATFSTEVTPFNITVKQSFLDWTHLKVSLTRIVHDTPGQPEFTDGPPKRIVENVTSFWNSNYSWQAVEAHLNSKLRQFTTIVTAPEFFNGTPIPLHFVHHRSPRADAIPLLHIHGWPSSFIEVEPLIEALTNPPNSSLPAFHVVAPSIPGFSFSPSPLKAGMGIRAIGAAMNALMQKLGYHRYVAQGGDFGAIIERAMAVDFPEAVVALHSYFWVMSPAPSDLQRYFQGLVTDDEKRFIGRTESFNRGLWTSFASVHTLRPRKLSAALADSPVGLAMWIYDLEVGVTWNPDQVWTPERIITWAMMHWIPGVYGALAIYEYAAQDHALSTNGFDIFPFVLQPVALSEFALDIWYGLPLDWAQRRGNVKVRNVHSRGGHLPTLDAPDLVLNDAWAFFGNAKLSNIENIRL
ncbi:alpha/beta-hydrolase [Periconia macrospinosa]|uniref:Alpha/beta-hydrolase n=1 Tax=Periconia macrospinosa TaxID=97972 RepID=A0A2V1DYG2_9PLEO|nr:alpha/beta-hydrolase [Periconia macrospinosa]